MKQYILIILLFTNVLVFSQQAVVPVGGNASGTGGSISFSIGQIFYQSYQSDEGSLSEGVQQPYEIYVATSIDETDHINLVFNAFPNPTRDILTLSVDGSPMDKAGVKYQLFDLVGRLYSSGMVESHQTSINMGTLSPGTYLLKVMQGSIEMKSFKIIKH